MDFSPKKIDVYITRKFILTFAIALVLIIGIVIIFDISEKVDDFVETKASLKSVIFDYYMNFIPYFVNMFSPLFVFLTVIFFTSRLAANSEIVAILSCGVSFHRLMVPYIFSAAIIAFFSLALNLWVIPKANVERNAFEAVHNKYRRNVDTQKDIHYQIDKGNFVYVETFSKWNNTCYKFTLETIKDNRLVSKLSAESAVWDSLSGSWRLRNYFIREYSENSINDKVIKGEKLDTVIKLNLKDFQRQKYSVQDMTSRELNEFIAAQRLRGDANVKFSLIEKHNRYAMPFSAFILTIIGVSLSSKKKRGGIGWNLAVGIALSFSYIMFQRFSQMFVYTGVMPTALAMWLPNMIYAVIAAVLYKIAPK